MIFMRILMVTTQTEKENLNYVWWYDYIKDRAGKTLSMCQ